MTTRAWHMSTWYFEELAEQKGPFTHEEISEYIKQGKVLRETLVWKAGTDNWVRADAVVELKALLDQYMPLVILPPPLPNSYKIPASYAWRRFFAKTFDLMLALTIALIAVAVITPDQFSWFVISSSVAAIFIWLSIEVLTSCRTIGRKFLGINVIRLNENVSFFERSIVLLVGGLALEIPVISFATKIFSYFTYRKTGTTLWDKANYRVQFENINPLRYVFFFVILTALLLVQTFAGGIYGSRLKEKIDNNALKTSINTDNFLFKSTQNQLLKIYEYNTQLESSKVVGTLPVILTSGFQVGESNGVTYLENDRLRFQISIVQVVTNPQISAWDYADYLRSTYSGATVLAQGPIDGLKIASYDALENGSQLTGFRQTSYFFQNQNNDGIYYIAASYPIEGVQDTRAACTQLKAVFNALNVTSVYKLPNLGFTSQCKEYF